MLTLRNRNLIFLFFSLGILASCVQVGKKEIVQEIGVEGTEGISVEKIELQELVSAPKKWKDLYIETEGYYQTGFEKSALYISSSDYEVEEKALWLNFDEELSAKMPQDSEYNGKKVRVRGRVSLKKGHLMQYSATIGDVYYIALVEE